MCLDIWRAVCADWKPRVENSRELVKLRLRPHYRLRELQRSKRVRGWNELSRAVHSLEVQLVRVKLASTEAGFPFEWQLAAQDGHERTVEIRTTAAFPNRSRPAIVMHSLNCRNRKCRNQRYLA